MAEAAENLELEGGVLIADNLKIPLRDVLDLILTDEESLYLLRDFVDDNPSVEFIFR